MANLVDFGALFQGLSPQLATVLTAAIPIAELRVALPLAMTVWHLPFWTAYGWSVLGNLLPVVALLALLDPLARLARHWPPLDRALTWLFARTRRKTESNVARFGVSVGLAIFVAIPLPLTGAWTGAVAAYLFGVRYVTALIAITVGVLIAGLIVGALTGGVLTIIRV